MSTTTINETGATMARPIFAGLAAIQLGNMICRRLCAGPGLFDSVGIVDEMERIIAERYEANPPRVTRDQAEEIHLEESRERELEGSQFGMGA